MLLATIAQHADHANAIVDAPGFAWLIPGFPLLAAILCGLAPVLGYRSDRSRWPAWVGTAGLALAFATSLAVIASVGRDRGLVTVFEWIHVAGLEADFAFFIDPLTEIMLIVVTGIATLVALYASEYMKGDRGYARFFAFVSLFVVAMTCLVLADNLILLYLGWEGVGLCSYLLIGFYYNRPSAVAAAKKAFIVNRVGDFGFALGILLTFREFGTVEFQPLLEALHGLSPESASPAVKVIPFLLMVGAFGKSAQIPLHVWLPDAMEGPTPVSALIHAATMVTAGIYMIARLIPLFLLSEYALPTVAWIGGITAVFAATIGMAQYDIKRIFAYSTISQLGYMFMGLGLLTTTGAVFHLFTHAFFKALLFLGCGAVMHGFAGQLDLRHLSGLRKVPGWQITTWTMLIGCLALAGFPLTSGFFSKDLILATAFDHEGPGYAALGVIGLITAFITAYYTFRVFFRVFMGPERYEPGDEHGHHGAHEHFHPHAPGLAINLVLIVLAVGALLAGWVGVGEHHGWFGGMIHDSTANIAPENITMVDRGGTGFFSDPHKWMMALSSVVALLGIGVAWYLHLHRRATAERWRRSLGALPSAVENRWGVDEGYDLLIRKPLRAVAHGCYLVGDTIIINGLVSLAGTTPRLIGAAVRPLQQGIIQQYGLQMAAGLASVLIIVWWLL